MRIMFVSGFSRKFRIILVLLLFSMPVHAEFSLASLLESMAAVKNSTAGFTEERHSRLLNKPMKLSGELIYKAPDTLIKHTRKPLSETFTIKGNTLAVERMHEGKMQRHEVLLDNFPALAPVVLGLRSVLSGDKETLEQYYTVDFSGNEKRWTILLKPRRRGFEEDDWLKDVVKQVTIKGSGIDVNLMEILEPGGDRNITRIKHN